MTHKMEPSWKSLPITYLKEQYRCFLCACFLKKFLARYEDLRQATLCSPYPLKLHWILYGNLLMKA